MVAVIIPVVLIEAVVDRPTAVTPVKLAPLIAGSVPVILAAGTFVKLAALIAGKAPESFDAVSVDILASATVPVKLPAGILVKFAPLPVGLPVKLPTKVVAVTIPEALIPLEKLTAELPSTPFISVTLISDMLIEYFYLFS